MKKILYKCTRTDLEVLSEILDSYASLTDDKKRKALLASSIDNPQAHEELIELMDQQIRYYGSSDVAWLKRMAFGEDGGVEADEVINDVCKRRKVKIKVGTPIEAKLEALTKAIAHQELCRMDPVNLCERLRKEGVDNQKVDRIIEHLKANGPVAILPVLYRFAGPEITFAIIEAAIIRVMSVTIGKEAAKHLLAELVKRNPWLATLVPFVGPLLSGGAAAWLAYDIQSPAFRKTEPICMYLGVVALRDGLMFPVEPGLDEP